MDGSERYNWISQQRLESANKREEEKAGSYFDPYVFVYCSNAQPHMSYGL